MPHDLGADALVPAPLAAFQRFSPEAWRLQDGAATQGKDQAGRAVQAHRQDTEASRAIARLPALRQHVSPAAAVSRRLRSE